MWNELYVQGVGVSYLFRLHIKRRYITSPPRGKDWFMSLRPFLLVSKEPIQPRANWFGHLRLR